jgi:hypothetical protein
MGYFVCISAHPAVIRAGVDTHVSASIYLPEYHRNSYSRLQVVILPAVENGNRKPNLVLSDPILLEPVEVSHYISIPLPSDLPIGTYCIGVLNDEDREGLFFSSNHIEIINAGTHWPISPTHSA